MSITYPAAPSGGQEVVETHLREILSSQQQRGPGLLRDVDPRMLSIAQPHHSYFVRLDDLVEGRLLSAAKPVAWRYLLVQGANAVGEVELTAPEEPQKAPEFIALSETPFAESTLAALEAAQALPRVRLGKFEFRLLKIPAVYFVGAWLHSKKLDLLLPLNEVSGTLKQYKAYTEKQVLTVLMPIARTIQEFELHPK